MKEEKMEENGEQILEEPDLTAEGSRNREVLSLQAQGMNRGSHTRRTS